MVGKPRVLVAVASNFAPVLSHLKSEFESASGYALVVSPGSTGKLFAQVVAGAPYDVLLAADVERPQRLEEEGLAVQRFEYARGQLVLWSASVEPLTPVTADDFAAAFLAPDVRRVALPNPALAPYGRAAEQTLASLGVLEAVRSKLVFGENIGQAHALVATENAQLGFTAHSYVLSASQLNDRSVSYTVVPSRWHTPVIQQGVLLRRAAENPAALAFVEFLSSAAVQRKIFDLGYGGQP